MKNELRTKLKRAFIKLEKNGYTVRHNFWCCRTCAWHALTYEEAEKTVFYTMQDNDNLRRGEQTCLSWRGDGQFICETLRSFGISVEWNQQEDTRIIISKSVETK